MNIVELTSSLKDKLKTDKESRIYKLLQKNPEDQQVLQFLETADFAALCRYAGKCSGSFKSNTLGILLKEFKKRFPELDQSEKNKLGLNGYFVDDITYEDLLEIGLFGKVGCNTPGLEEEDDTERDANLSLIYSSNYQNTDDLFAFSAPDYVAGVIPPLPANMPASEKINSGEEGDIPLVAHPRQSPGDATVSRGATMSAARTPREPQALLYNHRIELPDLEKDKRTEWFVNEANKYDRSKMNAKNLNEKRQTLITNINNALAKLGQELSSKELSPQDRIKKSVQKQRLLNAKMLANDCVETTFNFLCAQAEKYKLLENLPESRPVDEFFVSRKVKNIFHQYTSNEIVALKIRSDFIDPKPVLPENHTLPDLVLWAYESKNKHNKDKILEALLSAQQLNDQAMTMFDLSMIRFFGDKNIAAFSGRAETKKIRRMKLAEYKEDEQELIKRILEFLDNRYQEDVVAKQTINAQEFGLIARYLSALPDFFKEGFEKMYFDSVIELLKNRIGQTVFALVYSHAKETYPSLIPMLLDACNNQSLSTVLRHLLKSPKREGASECMNVALSAFQQAFANAMTDDVKAALGLTGKQASDITLFDLMEIGILKKVNTAGKTPAQIAVRNQNLSDIYSEHFNDPKSIVVKSLPDLIYREDKMVDEVSEVLEETEMRDLSEHPAESATKRLDKVKKPSLELTAEDEKAGFVDAEAELVNRRAFSSSDLYDSPIQFVVDRGAFKKEVRVFDNMSVVTKKVEQFSYNVIAVRFLKNANVDSDSLFLQKIKDALKQESMAFFPSAKMKNSIKMRYSKLMEQKDLSPIDKINAVLSEFAKEMANLKKQLAEMTKQTPAKTRDEIKNNIKIMIDIFEPIGLVNKQGELLVVHSQTALASSLVASSHHKQSSAGAHPA